MNEEIDEFMRKLLKEIDAFKQKPDEKTAFDIEVQLSILRVLIGDGFNDLKAFVRVEKEVSEFLDCNEKKKKGVK